MKKTHMFGSKWHCKPRNNTGQDVKQLTRAIKFVVLVNQGVEEVGYALPDHLSSRDQLSVESVKDVF